MRARLAGLGSPEYELTWKHWDIGSQPQICALRASARRTSANDSSGWPTSQATDYKVGDRPRRKGGSSNRMMSLRVEGWPKTPQASDGEGGVMEIQPGTKGKYKLRDYAQTARGWNTPRATDGSNGGPNQAGGALPADAASAGWPTPMAGSPGTEDYNEAGGTDYSRKVEAIMGLRESPNGRKGWTTPQAHDATARGKGQKAKHGTKHGCADLNADAAKVIGWPTSTASDGTKGFKEGQRQPSLGEHAARAKGWPTPVVGDRKGGSRNSRPGSNSAKSLCTKAHIAGWPTSSARDGKGRARDGSDGWEREGTGSLPEVAAGVAGWGTPTSGVWGGTPEQALERKRQANARGAKLGVVVSALDHQVQMVGGWPTPNTMQGGQTSRGGKRKGEKLMGGLARGTTLSSSPAPTGPRGVLAAEFSRWLMGYPATWDAAAPGSGSWLAWQALMPRLSLKPSEIESDD